MDLIFDIVVDFIVSLFFHNADNIMKNKKISKWIRYPVIFIIVVLCLFTTIVPIIAGIVLLNKNTTASVIFIIIGILFTLLIIYEIKKIIKENKALNEEHRKRAKIITSYKVYLYFGRRNKNGIF